MDADSLASTAFQAMKFSQTVRQTRMRQLIRTMCPPQQSHVAVWVAAKVKAVEEVVVTQLPSQPAARLEPLPCPYGHGGHFAAPEYPALGLNLAAQQGDGKDHHSLR
ncbi:hypothetical protein GCM10023115_19850 [Pontixanthobacter gangjinensis]